MNNKPNNSGLIFMKVGLHAQESIEDIVKRKQTEYEETGSIFWGYGGNTCHPFKAVQPFAKGVEEKGEQVLIVMHKMDSNHTASPEIAREYSDDGINWQPIPKGIEVRGSQYALILDELRFEEFNLDLRTLEVGIGNCKGRRADNYLKGRVDKGCFFQTNEEVTPVNDQKLVKQIDLIARVKPPYAVELRT